MNEFEAIVILAAIFITFYIVGSVRNRRLLVRYSQAIKKHIGSISEFVGFRPYGSSGFRALGNMRKEIPLSKMEIAVSLVDRENVMHYPLALITNEHDKITVWGFLRGAPGLSLEICSRKDHASFQKQRAGLTLTETVIAGEELKALFQISSSDRARATGILGDDQLQERLMRVKNFLRYLLIDERESRVFLTGKLTSESLGPLLDLVILSGKKVSQILIETQAFSSDPISVAATYREIGDTIKKAQSRQSPPIRSETFSTGPMSTSFHGRAEEYLVGINRILLATRPLGGQWMTTSKIENFPFFL